VRQAMISAAVALALATAVAEASAESEGADTLAETLYRQGRQLMTDGHYAEACAKFAESQRLDPASGTLLNLAGCHEAEHQYATAWLEYTSAKTWALRDQRDDRVTFAEERIRAIEPKLSHLTVVVGSEANAPGLEVEVDGVTFRGAARGVPMPVDPGSHRVDARAEGRRSWSQVVEYGEAPSSLTVRIPVLEPVEAPGHAAAPILVPEPARETRSLPTSVYVSGAVTVGAALGAAGTGIWFVSKKSAYDRSQDDSDRRSALAAGWLNAGFTLIALAGAGATAYLYWTRPTEATTVGSATKGAAWMVSPWAGIGSGGVVVRGAL
jgi:hypothetical protein